MAESSLAEVTHENNTIALQVSRLSDRAIQRMVGGNAFLRGRLYARRGAVGELFAQGQSATARVKVMPDVDYEVRAELIDQGNILSQCSCPAWRGPTGHCKHLAALLVALRDRERPPRPAAPPGNEPRPEARSRDQQRDQQDDDDAGDDSENVTSITAGGKRRRSRRRKRGNSPTNGAANPSVFELSTTWEPTSPNTNERAAGLDAWLSTDENHRAYDYEFRMAVKAASLSVTTVLAGTRTAVPLSDALAAFNVVNGAVRCTLRLLARHASRTTPATGELRSEDAAELLSALKGRRVLLEPASMELRFVDDVLRPKIELDLGSPGMVRVRVVFESKNGVRKFSLSSGAWFEGTPGWHIDTTEGVARPISDTVTPGWLQRLYRSPSLLHPISELPRLLVEFMPRLANALGTSLPDLSSVADLVDAQPHFKLRCNGDIIEANAKLSVVYDGLEVDVPVGGFPSPLAFQPSVNAGQRPRVVRRDVGAELLAVQSLEALGFKAAESGNVLQVRGDQAIAFWTQTITQLPDAWEKFIPDDLAQVEIRNTPVKPQVRVSSGVDWLSLDMTFNSEGVAVSEDELRMCLSQGKRLIKLADGTYAPVKADEVGEVLERMAELVALDGQSKKLPLSQAGRVQDLLKLVSTATVAKGTKELFEKLDHIGEIEQIAKPRNLKASLRPYQKEGFSWLVFIHNLNSGGILADDMGLGKTLQTIALLLWNKAKNKDGLSLVVAPTSVVPNWLSEIEKFAPSLKALMWQGPDRHQQVDELDNVDIMITSYALMRRDEEFLQTRKFQYVILDEAQHIKNPMSATARTAKKIKSERRLALSGTPIENRLSEIWSIFDFVSPGLLGNLQTFEEKFARPIDRGDDKAVTKLRSTVHPFILRRTKSEVAKDLPEKIEQEMVVPLAEEQSKLYKQVLRQTRESLLSEVEEQGLAKSQIQILAALTRLRQVACDPRLINLPGDWNDDESGKLSALREIVSNAVAGGHRVLVFSQFVEMLKLIRAVLEQDNVKYEYLDGSTKDRQERVVHFNTDESVSVFLVSLKAGGTGLNLTGADTVVHFDPWWNPAVEDQATDRAHRIGQTRVVSVYRLIAKGTVEEKILQLSAKKRALVSNVLAQESGTLKGITREDLEDLFGE